MSAKPSKVTILSDIVLNRGTPQKLSDSTNNTPAQTTTSVSSKNHTIKEDSLKRKTGDDFINEVTPKKTKLGTLNKKVKKKDKVVTDEEETVFNYMTGAYEKVTKIEAPPKKTESPEIVSDIKDELTIEENILKTEDITEDIRVPLKDKIEEIKSEDVKPDIKPNEQPIVNDKKSTVTIDLTDDDDTEPNISMQNNILVQNLLSLQNAIALQSKSECDTKISLPKLQSNSPLKNLQGNIIIQNPNLVVGNSLSIGNQGTLSSTVNQQMVLVVQNNSTYLVPQNIVFGNNAVQSLLVPNNLNIQNNVMLGNKHVTNVSNVTNLVLQANQIQNSTKSLGIPPLSSIQKPILPKNSSLNLVPKSNSNTNISLNTIKGSKDWIPILPQKTLWSSSENKSLNIVKSSKTWIPVRPLESPSTNKSPSRFNKSVTHPTQNYINPPPNSGFSSPEPGKLSQSPINSSQNPASSSQNPNNSSQNPDSSSQNLNDSSQNPNNSSQSPNNSSQNSDNSLQNFKTPSVSQNSNYLQKSDNTSQNIKYPSGSSRNLKSSLQKFPNTAQTPIRSFLENASTLNNSIQNSSENFACHTCVHKASSKMNLILHIYKEHLSDQFELNLKCKICDFETEFLSVMEKHDLGHSDASKRQENLTEVGLSENVEIKIRMSKSESKTIVKNNSVIKDGTEPDTPVDIIDLSDSEDEISAENLESLKEFRCFDCDYVSSKKRSLQNHAVRHNQSKFQCRKHATISETCPECVYKKCLSDLGKSMFVCTKCGYKTCRKQCFESHIKNQSECDQGNITKLLFSSDSESDNEKILLDGEFRCFHCSYIAKSLDLLKTHSVQHFGGIFVCDIHKSKELTCNKCIYGMILSDLKRAVLSCTCGFSTFDRGAHLRHTSNKEYCEQFKNKFKEKSLDRNKFLNESVLLTKKFQKSSAGNEIIKNSATPVSAAKNTSYENLVGETQSTDTEAEENSGDFKCFHCTYVTNSRGLLRCHAVRHCDQDFECSLHLQNPLPSCKKCLYKTVLLELNKKVFICEVCRFKTLRKATFVRHQGKVENCLKYRRQRAPNTVERSESESDAEHHKAKNHIRKTSRLEKNDEATTDNSLSVDLLLPLSKLVLICAQCNFRTLNKDIFQLHERRHELGEDEDETPLLNCFDCNEFCTEDREILKDHAVAHYKKKFSCDKHSSTENSQDCGKCIYLSIKKDMESDIIICTKCSFKTLRKDLFEQHKTSKYLCRNYRRTLGDIDDDYVPENDVGALESDSAEENRDSVSASYSMKKRVEDASKLQNSLLNAKGSPDIGKVIQQVGSDIRHSVQNNVTKKIPIYNFKCFDCGLEFLNQSALERHVAAHKESSFRCGHPTFYNKCKKCLYQYILEKYLGKKTLSCKCCGYNCNDTEAMRNHIKGNVKCQGLSVKSASSTSKANVANSKKYQCYDCGIEWESRIKLWNHAATHKSVYRCLEHKDSPQNDCGKCLYAYIQKHVHPSRFKCFDCPKKLGYTTELELRSHIEFNHENSKFLCNIHTTALVDTCEKCRYAYLIFQTSKKLIYHCAECPPGIHPYESWKYLKRHIISKHPNSTAKCLVHIDKKPFLGDCNRCLFEKILDSLRPIARKQYQCCECSLKTLTKEKLEVHVRIMHEDSKFQCTTHSLGDIDDKCSMCIYESIVVLMNS